MGARDKSTSGRQDTGWCRGGERAGGVGENRFGACSRSAAGGGCSPRDSGVAGGAASGPQGERFQEGRRDSRRAKSERLGDRGYAKRAATETGIRMATKGHKERKAGPRRSAGVLACEFEGVSAGSAFSTSETLAQLA